MHRNTVQHICTTAYKLKKCNFFFPLSQLDLYFKPIAPCGKNKSNPFQDSFPDIFLELHLRTRRHAEKRGVGVCVDTWFFVIIQPCYHLLTWPSFYRYLVDLYTDVYSLITRLPPCGPILPAASTTRIQDARHFWETGTLIPLMLVSDARDILMFLCLINSEVIWGSNQLHNYLFESH